MGRELYPTVRPFAPRVAEIGSGPYARIVKPRSWSMLFTAGAVWTVGGALWDAVHADWRSAAFLFVLAALMAEGARRGTATFRFGLFTAVFVLSSLSAAVAAAFDHDWALAAGFAAIAVSFSLIPNGVPSRRGR
jgi:hypothetical protein